MFFDNSGNHISITVGNSPDVLENKNDMGIVITNERGQPKVMGDAGIAIGGTESNAKVGKAGLAYVYSGDASAGPNAVAITRGHGTADAGDGGVAVAMNGGNASVVRGVAVVLNSRPHCDAKAMGYLGAVLVFGYFKDDHPETTREFAVGIVDNENIEPLVQYRVTREGKIIKA
jgi:hypothetical protein